MTRAAHSDAVSAVENRPTLASADQFVNVYGLSRTEHRMSVVLRPSLASLTNGEVFQHRLDKRTAKLILCFFLGTTITHGASLADRVMG